eukprot:gene81-87_t
MSFQWTSPDTQLLLESVLIEVRKGNTAERGFKKQQWSNICNHFNATRATRVDKTVLQNKLTALKKKYQTFQALRENSGFVWDEALQLPTAPDQVWSEFLAVNKNARQFRHKTLEFYQELDEIFAAAPKAWTPGFTQQAEGTAAAEESLQLSSLSSSSSGKKSRKRVRNDEFMEAIIEHMKGLKASSSSSPNAASLRKPTQQAIQIFQDKFAAEFTVSHRVQLKVFFVENPALAELFVTLPEDEKLYFLQLNVNK